jgi:hypothetical protein
MCYLDLKHSRKLRPEFFALVEGFEILLINVSSGDDLGTEALFNDGHSPKKRRSLPGS